VIPERIDPNALLRLKDAVEVAFPLGGMTVKGLRREMKRRGLIHTIAGKQFVTLQSIQEIKQCHAKPGALTSTSANTQTDAHPSGSSEVSQEERKQAQLSARMLINNQKLTRLRQSSRRSATRQRRRPKASVIPIK
jgi:hypothetical protein